MSKLLDTLKRMFPLWHSDRLSRDLQKVKQLSERELKKQELHKKLFSNDSSTNTSRLKKKKQHYVHIKVDSLLKKAGLSFDTSTLYTFIFRLALVAGVIASVLLLVYAYQIGATWSSWLLLLGISWLVVVPATALLAGMVFAVYVDVQITKRRNELEAVLPDFLQLTAANIGAGMPVDRALWFAVRPRFGVLAKEIETVAKRVLTGEELSEALKRFSSQYDSVVLSRSINLLLEGIAAGGHIADLLHKISVDIQEQRILRKEMAASVMTYVIFISFASVLAAPILFGLSTELLVVIQSIAQSMGGDSTNSLLSLSGDAIALRDFRIFSLTVLAGSAFMSSLIVGVIRSGDAKKGLRFTIPFVAVSVVLYWAAVAFFHAIFGGLV